MRSPDLDTCEACELEITGVAIVEKCGTVRCAECHNALVKERVKAKLAAEQQRGTDLAAHIKETAIAMNRAAAGHLR